MNNLFLKEVLSWVKALVIALVIVMVCRHFLITPSIVKGESMMPNLQDGDRILLSKISKIERFDEIAFHAPDSEDNYVKRVIGLPGDEIEMKNDTLYINNEAYNEPYLKMYKEELSANQYLTNNFTLEELTNQKVVPKGHYFVLGDNRSVSKDSRSFGFIREDTVIGDVKMRIWPLNTFGVPR
ncbi:signal peptidase I [Aquibacillus rhizosphaerae]|uniref:Signal peptidase I n=1 Tax=Aquibacillus rhizosphaerae TaxID=3051431 RepID=A0ABT7L5H6_9BACI|nr:signal peptidase I [Aquibacillus sp. LR5S19]MDL4841121.1 signal peptidase I [Aquibacillus sp. LR5S19]